jgi:hypothetical protein
MVGPAAALLGRALKCADLVAGGEDLQMECGPGLEGRRRDGGQHVKYAERQTGGFAEDTRIPCSHAVRDSR